MKANPGGSIDPGSVVGREVLIDKIWQRLETQCVLLNAERRIGKTCMVQKMAAEPAKGWFGVYQDLESIHSAAEFAATVHDHIQQFLGQWKKKANSARKLYENHDFANLSKRQDRPWKDLLTSSIQDLIDAKVDQRLVMLWDEVPYMIANIAKSESEQTATEVLDTLRAIRQGPLGKLRMLFTGSIGLHHVLSSLHEAGIATEPLNDMFEIEVPPLDHDDACNLAKRLLAGEGLASDDANEAANLIAKETDGFAFYIQHVVCSLSTEQLPANPDTIRELIGQHLVASTDPWQLGHFRERIAIYYRNTNDATLVGIILDSMCSTNEPRSLENVQDAVNIQSGKFPDSDRLVKILRLMERDHYLKRDLDGNYQFRFQLIRRWWKLDRGIS